MNIEPFNFARLKSVSRAELRLQTILQQFLPTGKKRLKLLHALEKTLQESIRGGCTLHLKDYHLQKTAIWQDRSDEAAVYVTLTTAPTGAKALLVFDPVLALCLIDRLLGGSLTEVPAARVLTELEAGVFSYLLMQVCRTFHQSHPSEHQAPIRVAKIFSEPEQLETILAGTERLVVADATVALPELSLPVQIVLPDAFVEEVLAPRSRQPMEQLSIAQQRQGLMAYGDLSFAMRASAGETTLTPREVAHLEAGDIILLDQPHVHFEEGQIAGQLQVYPVHPGAPTFLTKIRDTHAPACLEVMEVYRGV